MSAAFTLHLNNLKYSEHKIKLVGQSPPPPSFAPVRRLTRTDISQGTLF
jgi:hypothetical protein